MTKPSSTTEKRQSWSGSVAVPHPGSTRGASLSTAACWALLKRQSEQTIGIRYGVNFFIGVYVVAAGVRIIRMIRILVKIEPFGGCQYAGLLTAYDGLS